MNEQPQEQPLLTPEDVKNRLKLGRTATYLLLASEIPVVRVGGQLRVTEQALADYIAKQTRQPARLGA